MKPLVPAVDRALAILQHLAGAGAEASTFSGIAAALGLNKSTCSNILRALEEGGMVERDATRRYRLGPELIGLGAAAARHRDFVRIASGALEDVVRETGFTTVAFDRVPSGEFLIVAKVESAREIKATIDLGQHFPASAPALLRATLAWAPEEAIEERLGRRALGRVRAELERTRARGYAVSRGEYYPANTAIAAPVFDGEPVARRGICLIAFTTEIDDRAVASAGRAVRAAAEAIGRAMGARASAAGTASARSPRRSRASARR